MYASASPHADAAIYEAYRAVEVLRLTSCQVMGAFSNKLNAVHSASYLNQTYILHCRMQCLHIALRRLRM